MKFKFNAKSPDGQLKGTCTVTDRAADVRVKCLDVVSFVREGTHATIFGNGTINGMPTAYRLNLDDLDDPGTGIDTLTIITDSGYAAGGVLENGNVKIQ